MEKRTQSVEPAEASAPYFLPYQDRWIADDAPFKLYEKSRRIGATYATSYRCFQKCLRRRDFTQWVSSRDLLTAKEFITDYVARWCKLGRIAATGLAGETVEVIDPDRDITAFVAAFPLTGSRIVSLSSTPAAFAGKGGDVLLDEVDLHAEPGVLIDMAMPCTIWGGQLEAVSAYAVDGSPASVFARLCLDAKGDNPMRARFHRTTLLDAGDEAAAAELLLDFRVADISMGSGHFLTAAIDAIEAIITVACSSA
jgi:phage FluMu gp28-like protein